jgi:hypothetical protein
MVILMTFDVGDEKTKNKTREIRTHASVSSSLHKTNWSVSGFFNFLFYVGKKI